MKLGDPGPLRPGLLEPALAFLRIPSPMTFFKNRRLFTTSRISYLF